MQCIGVDVSKQELVTYDGVRGQTFPNDKQLDKFTEYLDSVEHVVVVFEPTSTYSHRLQALCARRSISICQLNPRVVPNLRKASRRRSKTDKTDAELLYQYGIDRGKDEAREAKQVDWLVHALSAQLALYRVTQKSRVAYQGVLEAVTNDPFTEEAVVEGLKAEIVAMKGKEARCVARAEEIIKEDQQASSTLQALLSIPGLGPITAITLLMFFRRYQGANRQQIVALAGLDPMQYQSGTSVHRRGRISKRGSRELRKRLYEATLSAARYNVSVQQLYQRLKEAGKPEKVARTAAARKLLLIAHAIYKTGERYRSPISPGT